MTTNVLGISIVLDRLKPDSEVGWNRPVRGFNRSEQGEWAREIDRLREAEAWADADLERTSEVRNAFSELPLLDRVVTMLAASSDLDDAALFATKRFAYWALRIVDRTEDLLPASSSPRGRGEDLRSLLAAIHPERDPSPRFRLSSDLLPDLGTARKTHKKARTAHKTARKALEDEIVEALGGRFDLRGFYEPVPSRRATELEEAGLQLIDGRWRPASRDLDAAIEALDVAEVEVWRLEDELRTTLTEVVSRHIDQLVELEADLAELDNRLASVRLKDAIRGCWPEQAETFELEAGRDPRLEVRLGEDIQPIDVRIESGATIVTGPNMGGKSALLRLVGLVQWLAQHTLPIPAARAAVPMYDGLVYIGSEADDVVSLDGLSSFGREVRRLVENRDGADAPTLWLLDEFGRGTHPQDGASLAIDVVNDLVIQGHTVVAATHFPELAQTPGASHLRIRGLTDSKALEASIRAAEDATELREALQNGMDYRPDVVHTDDVPRDARIVARALGLTFSETVDG